MGGGPEQPLVDSTFLIKRKRLPMVQVFSQYFFMFENSLVQQIVTVVLIRDSIWRSYIPDKNRQRMEGEANSYLL